MISSHKMLLSLISALLLMFSPPAHAWGQLKELNSPELLKSHLVYVVLKRHEIKYCLYIDSSQQGGFTYDSLNVQTRAALNLWLAPVMDIVGKNVLLTRVDCSDDSVNMMVRIEPNEAQNWSHEDTYHDPPHTEVIINSDYRYQSQGQMLPIIDLQTIVTQRLADKNVNLKQVLDLANEHKMNESQFASWTDLPETVIFNSSYIDLIHEIGHAYGLCDLGKVAFENDVNCDMNFVSSKNWSDQPESVMMSGIFFYLTDDDIAGIRALFKRFNYLQAGEAK